MYRLGNVLFDDWQTVELGKTGFDIKGWTDTFIWKVDAANAMLPPSDYARLVRAAVSPVLKLRRSLSLWVQVSGGGSWYRGEVARSLRGSPFPYSVASDTPRSLDFSFMPWWSDRPSPAPPLVNPQTDEQEVTWVAALCLRALARVKRASTLEVASLIGASIPSARAALKELLSVNLVMFNPGRQGTARSPDSFWEIRRSGLSRALRGWHLPPGTSFAPFAERRRSKEGGRHRRTSRLWRLWLERSYRGLAHIHACWSEVAIPGMRAGPDALAWGHYAGQETLYWLEVETGNQGRTKIRDKTHWRLSQALSYARQFNCRLIFGVLGVPWAAKAAQQSVSLLPDYAGLVSGDWGQLGSLPLVRWGGVGG